MLSNLHSHSQRFFSCSHVKLRRARLLQGRARLLQGRARLLQGRARLTGTRALEYDKKIAKPSATLGISYSGGWRTTSYRNLVSFTDITDTTLIDRYLKQRDDYPLTRAKARQTPPTISTMGIRHRFQPTPLSLWYALLWCFILYLPGNQGCHLLAWAPYIIVT